MSRSAKGRRSGDRGAAGAHARVIAAQAHTNSAKANANRGRPPTKLPFSFGEGDFEENQFHNKNVDGGEVTISAPANYPAGTFYRQASH